MITGFSSLQMVKKWSNTKRKNKVYVWGLNDKSQLCSAEGGKIRVPVLSHQLSALHINHIVGGSKTLFVATEEGKVRRR